MVSPSRTCSAKPRIGSCRARLRRSRGGQRPGGQQRQIVAEGRNRAYDPGGGPERLEGTPLAHAELDVLAAVATSRGLETDLLWSTIQPCPMCDAALVFTGVGTVCWLAPDPTLPAPPRVERAAEKLHCVAPHDERWLIVSTTLFLASIALRRGLSHPTVSGNRLHEPETAYVLERLFGLASRKWTTAALPDMLAVIWDDVVRAAADRRHRFRTSSS